MNTNYSHDACTGVLAQSTCLLTKMAEYGDI